MPFALILSQSPKPHPQPPLAAEPESCVSNPLWMRSLESELDRRSSASGSRIAAVSANRMSAVRRRSCYCIASLRIAVVSANRMVRA